MCGNSLQAPVTARVAVRLRRCSASEALEPRGDVEISTVRSFIDYFESVRSRTRRLIAVIPVADLEFRPKPGMFSAGDIVRHVAGTERYMFVENALGRPSRYPGHDVSLASGFEAAVAYFDGLHAESIALLRSLSDSDLRGRCVTPGGAEITTWKWLRAMVEHEIHHRGQLYSVLAVLGVATPPLYGLTEAQVKERSISER